MLNSPKPFQIIVWNGEDLSESLVRLKGHTGLVKGVVFDPVGKYLASQSDDRSLRVWRLSDWKQETVIKEPFKECGATTHVLRPGWSPDGTMIVSAHAMNGGGPTAQIIERGKKWTAHKDFVGHKKAISCVRFNGKIFEKTKKNGKTEMFVMAALGSRDRSFSVWCTNLKRPLCVIGDIFDQSVLDLSWSKDGKVLLACSMDGSVAAAIFKSDEIGTPVPEDRVAQLMSVQYGKQFGQTLVRKKPTNGSVFVENPELLLKQQSNLSAVSTSNKEPPPKTPVKPRGPMDKQIEARTVDGKRRITPIFIPPPSAETLEQSQPFGSGQFGSFSTQQKSKIEIEKREDIVKPNVSPDKSEDSNQTTNVLVPKSAPRPKTLETKKEETTVPPKTSDPSDDNEPPVNVMQVRRKPSRPILDSSDEDDSPKEPTKTNSSQPEPTVSPPVRKLEPSKKPRERPELMSLKRGKTFPENGGSAEETSVRPKKRARISSRSDCIPHREEDTEFSALATPSESQMGDFSPETSVPVKSILLPRKKLDKKQTFHFDWNGEKYIVYVENHAHTVPSGTLNYVRGEFDHKEWEILLPSPICAMEFSHTLLIISCEDQSINLFSAFGTRMAPPIMVPGGTLLSATSKNYFAIVTCAAKMFLWRVSETGLKVEFRNECLSSILEGRTANSISKLTFTDNEQPVIVSKAGSAFIFSRDLGSWVRVGSSRQGLQSISCYSCHVPHLDQDKPNKTPLAVINALTPTPAHVDEVGVDIQVKANISFCESQKMAALFLRSPEEYRYWLVREVLHLSKLENTDRLRNLFDDLLGPGGNPASTSTTWEPKILNVEKRKLLKFALKVIASNPQLQRLHMEYQSQISNDIEQSKDEVSQLLGL